MLDRRHLAALALVGVVALLAALTSPEQALDRLRGVVFSPYFPAVLVALYLVRPFLGWPITLVSALVGYRYGVVVGFLVALPGTAFTSLPAYLLAGEFAGEDGLLGRAADGGRRFFDAAGDLRGLVAARLAPTPAEPVSGAAGLAGVSVPVFVVGTMVGEVPWTAAAVIAGASLERFAAGAVPADPLLVVAGVLAAALLLAAPAYRALRA